MLQMLRVYFYFVVPWNNKLRIWCLNHIFNRIFLVFVRLPIYCVYTQFLKNISSFLSFFYLLTCTVSFPSFHRNTSPKWLTPSFSICICDVIQPPGRPKMQCMQLKMIHKYTTANHYFQHEINQTLT